MKKSFGFFAAIWAVVFALFNLIVFIIPETIEVPGVGIMSKYGGGFWVGYIFIIIAFIINLICAFFAFKADSAKKMFYNWPLISISYTGLIIMLVVGTLCMVVPYLTWWVGVIVCAIIVGFNVIALIKASLVSDIVSDMDEKIKTKTFNIRMLTADAESLMNASKSGDFQAITKKVYEAIRYSDPMTNQMLVEIDGKVRQSFFQFEKAVNTKDVELANSTAEELLYVLNERNNRCKVLK